MNDMEVKEFVKEFKRMLETERNVKVIGTELRVMGGYGFNTSAICIGLTDEEIDFVEKWSKEHPQKTIADDFFEKHPDAKKFENGTPKVCAAYCGYCTDCRLDDYGDRDCYSCWNMPVNENGIQ